MGIDHKWKNCRNYANLSSETQSHGECAGSKAPYELTFNIINGVIIEISINYDSEKENVFSYLKTAEFKRLRDI